MHIGAQYFSTMYSSGGYSAYSAITDQVATGDSYSEKYGPSTGSDPVADKSTLSGILG